MTDEFFAEMEETLGIPARAIELYCDNHHIDSEDGLLEFAKHLNESYLGWYESGVWEFASMLIEDMLFEGGFNEHPLSKYVDVDAYTNDLEHEGYHAIEGYVFGPA